CIRDRSTPISNAANDPRPPKPETQWQQTEPPEGRKEAESAPSEPILFSSYTPKEAAPNTWLSLHGYVYKQSAAPQVSIDVGVLLGDKAGDYRELEQPAIVPVEAGALITATPNLPGFHFNPPGASIILLEDWHRFDFKLRATTAPVNQAANGSITFSVEGVIVADIPISIFVSPQAQSRSSAAPSGRLSPGVSPYRAVFCSYSHKDTAIVERVERAIKLLGYTYLRDATTLRSGENWNDALMKMIDQADIFQLFWSSNASKSKYVQQEWEYALKNKGTKANFIRPVYWEEPLPNVPDALGMLHFEYEPTLDDL
ncbi:MAG: toll/interleukin-1 receptor domain-containing protein, partial [Anaerolineae bacterium]|nr:toll/interleukin-1 receptor domain-containing protein [Anaerolineae bacterium]